uniref:HPt domain-containing protein n=1 Tax=Meloidogyne javanica TaxID=6303 RepID=A0A915LZU8_MELJA
MSHRNENLTGNDQRKAYLLKVASHILSLNLTEERLPSVTALNNFCLSDVPLLAISRLDQKGHVDLTTESGQEARLNNLVGELEESLINSTGNNNLGGREETGGGVVSSLRSEIELWRLRSKRGSDQAQNYYDALEPLAEHLEILEGNDLDLDELYTAIEAAEQSVDALWNLAVDEPYPQQRMKQLLNCIGEQIVRLLENRNGQQEGSASLRDQIQKAINNSMANANPFEFGPHTEQQWKSRLTATERALGPYIELLLPELRERILESGGNGGAMGDERELIIDEL